MRETNRYALELLEGSNSTRGGPGWTTLDVRELKTYMGICLLMKVKKSSIIGCIGLVPYRFYIVQP